ncbi:MAG: carboxypeptidase regulatory-like domain-containing protein, partial [Candidatus Diapherotrites archaeon]
MVSQKGFYESLEDKYYDLLDYLDSKGLPVYKAVDWLESKNIPSFPVVLASVFLVLVLVFFLFSSFFANAEVSVLVKDQEGNPVSNVLVGAYIDNQKFEEKSSDEKGSLVFQLPKGKQVEFRAKKQGYLEAKTILEIENDKESKTITLQSEITTITKTISVFEAGTGRAFSKDLEIEFRCSEKTGFSKTERVNDGIIEVQVPSDCGSIIAKPVGNYSFGNETIYLSDRSPRLEVSEQAQQRGSVFVSVANAQGTYLSGIDLRLYSVTEQGQQGSLVQEKQTASSGTTTFSEVPAGRYYIIAYDRSGNYSEYDGLKEGVVQEVKANSTTNFNLVMAQNVAGKIRLEVRDKATQEKIRNATVRLYKGNSQLTARETNEEGKVEFFLGEDVQYDLEIDKAGYLIKKINTKPMSDIIIVEIEQATLENSQSLLVNVLDESGKPIENARLKLKRNSDGSQIGSEIITGLDGRAIFERVEQGTYYVYALKPGYGEKNSEPINVSNRQQNITTIRIPLGSGRLEVNVVDEQGNVIAGANIKVVDKTTFQTIEESTTDSDGKKSFSIRPDKEPFLIVSAPNYAEYITTPTQVQKDTTKEKRVVLAKAIREFGIELEGIYVNNERISDNDNSLSQGQNYKAKFKIHVPKNSNFEEIEAHIRTGKETGGIEKDIAYITKVVGAFNNSQAGTSFNPPNNLALDLQTLTSGNSKWFNAIFKKPMNGIYELEAELQVREEARIGSSFELWYRVSGKSNGIIRDPNDSTLGTSANTSAKQGLYANAYKRVLTIGPSSLCNENFCSSITIENIREGITTNILESYTTQVDNKYKLKLDITGNSKTPFSNSQLIIKDRTGSIALTSYKINTALGEEKQGKPTGSEITIQVGDISKDSLVSGEIEFQPKKEGMIPLEVILTSNVGTQTEVFKKNILVKVQPAKQMDIDIIPKIIVPLIRNNVLVRVSSEGIALPNTKVNVFSNNETIAVGETDFEGVFAFTINSPSEGAQITIKAEKNGYKETQREIKITTNLITTEPEDIKLNVIVNDNELKAIEATILNKTQIPITIEKLYVSKALEGYTQIRFTEPKEGTTIQPDNNTNLSGVLNLGPKVDSITQPTKITGQIIVIATNNVFKQKWISTIPLEINLGFGEELDNTECFSITPNDWKIYSTNTQNQEMSFTITNNCTAQGNKVNLKNLSARIIAGNQNALGQFSAETSIENSQKIVLDNRFKTIANEIGKEAEEKMVITFKPENIVSGKAEPRIEVQATHMTSRGEQKLLQRINLVININNLNECVEVLTNKDIVVQSCPYNLGFANYGTRFSQYVNSRYAPYDPYATFYGYGTGQPPYLGTPNTPAQFADLYNYTGAYYPNNYYMAPFYTGIGSYNPMMANAWSCGATSVQVRNSCSTDVELSFDAQPGITTKEKTIQVQAGNTADVIIEPTNFFGRYALTIKGKTKETGQKTTDLKTIYVNVTNPFTKNYRDCISISPSRVIQFNNFIGKPVYLDIINTCYAEGVFLEESTNALMFPGLAIANPADISTGQPTGQPNLESSTGAREMIESYSFIEPQYRTQPNGKVVQVLRFELIKAIKNYRNKAPPLNLNEQNPFKIIGDLRYFLTSGYYAVETRTSAIVAFQNPFGMRQQIAFPIILRDWWNALDYAERITENYITYGDNTTEPESCINPQATDFLKYSPAPHNITYKTAENGYLFKKGETKTIAKPGPGGAQPTKVETGCGSVDYISLQIPEELTYKANNGLVMNIKPDPSDPSHELEITFDPTNWNGTATDISHVIHAKVTRQQTGKTSLVSFHVKFKIAENKEIIEKKMQITKTPQGTELTACTDEKGKEYGKTGAGIYKELGLDKISYEWREQQIKEDTCDAHATGSKYCDETQALLSISKKIEKIKEVMEKIKGTGECKGPYDCSNGLKSTEIYRYVVPQTEQGYFTNEDGSLL